jgi:hypothetical protein
MTNEFNNISDEKPELLNVKMAISDDDDDEARSSSKANRTDKKFTKKNRY